MFNLLHSPKQLSCCTVVYNAPAQVGFKIDIGFCIQDLIIQNTYISYVILQLITFFYITLAIQIVLLSIHETLSLLFFASQFFSSQRIRWKEITNNSVVLYNAVSKIRETIFITVLFGYSLECLFDFTQKFTAVSCHILHIYLINHVVQRLARQAEVFDF